jgi:hypothetical protein
MKQEVGVFEPAEQAEIGRNFTGHPEARGIGPAMSVVKRGTGRCDRRRRLTRLVNRLTHVDDADAVQRLAHRVPFPRVAAIEAEDIGLGAGRIGRVGGMLRCGVPAGATTPTSATAPASCFHESQQVGVDLFGVHRRHPMRVARIDLERAVLEQFGGQGAASEIGTIWSSSPCMTSVG